MTCQGGAGNHLKNTSKVDMRFALKEIALQSGLSLATVDRALHGRAHVRETTKARIRAAIDELERQYASSNLVGRRLTFDFVIEAPQRFSSAVRKAFEEEAGSFRPASLGTRFHLAERMERMDILKLLTSIKKRGSQGVVLKAPAHPEIVQAAKALVATGIPIATFVTDLPDPARHAYIGIDNARAGAAAAWLMNGMLAARPCEVLVTLSSASFMGEEEREAGFRSRLSTLNPALRVHTVAEGMGLSQSTGALVRKTLEQHRNIRAVYSAGGANQAILGVFRELNRPIHVFAAHDLDQSNRLLLAEERLSFVINHDLTQDARTAYRLFLHHHRMLPGKFTVAPSRFSIVTPDSLPSL